MVKWSVHDVINHWTERLDHPAYENYAIFVELYICEEDIESGGQEIEKKPLFLHHKN